MRIFTDLLFQHGHIADVTLAQQLAEPDTALDAAAQTTQPASVAPDAARQQRAEHRGNKAEAGMGHNDLLADGAQPEQQACHAAQRHAAGEMTSTPALMPILHDVVVCHRDR